MRRAPLASLLSILLLAALACNLPVQPGQPSPARQTLEAELFATRQPTEAAATQAAQTAEPAQPGLQTATPLPAGAPPPLLEALPAVGGTISYLIQPGDTLAGLAGRFAVPPESIRFPEGYTPDGLLPNGMQAQIPVTITDILPGGALLPELRGDLWAGGQGF